MSSALCMLSGFLWASFVYSDRLGFQTEKTTFTFIAAAVSMAAAVGLRLATGQ